MRSFHVTRRMLLGSLAAGATFAAVRPAIGENTLGRVLAVEGSLTRLNATPGEALSPGNSLIENDKLQTGKESFARLKLGEDTDILLGPNTHLVVDHFLAGQGGELELMSGQMLFDRPEGLPKIDVSVRTTFGMIGVRGTKFFAGPLQGVFSVFVEHGKIEVSNAGVSRKVIGGEGLEIRAPQGSTRSLGAKQDIRDIARLAIPAPPAPWAQDRIRAAYASVGLK